MIIFVCNGRESCASPQPEHLLSPSARGQLINIPTGCLANRVQSVRSTGFNEHSSASVLKFLNWFKSISRSEEIEYMVLVSCLNIELIMAVPDINHGSWILYQPSSTNKKDINDHPPSAPTTHGSFHAEDCNFKPHNE